MTDAKTSLRERSCARAVARAARTFPAVVITGPRQSGKTTLLKTLFGDTHAFANLENPDSRRRAREDPEAFLAQYPSPVIIDEIQYAPELLSYIKTRIDADRRPGRWLLTGSQNFSLMHNVSQSLAGRAAVLSLLPFSYAEAIGLGGGAREAASWLKAAKPGPAAGPGPGLSSWLLRGSYPEISSNPRVDRQLWCGSYITTYLERDIRNMAAVGDLALFDAFVRHCAARTAQILNLSDLARDVGVSVPTAKRWLSLLETSYQVYLLRPHYRNLGKRLVKSPKLYFTDTGLASYLLGLDDPKALLNGPSFGPLFETMVVVDFLKRFLHSGRRPPLSYLRTSDGLEVDLVVEAEGRLDLFEVKSAMTPTPQHAASLKRLAGELGPAVRRCAVISASESSFLLQKGIANHSWSAFLSR